MLSQQNISISEADTYLTHQFNRVLQILHDTKMEHTVEDLFLMLRQIGTEEDIATSMMELGEDHSQSTNKKWRAVIEKLKQSPRIKIVSRKPLTFSYNKELGNIKSYM